MAHHSSFGKVLSGGSLPLIWAKFRYLNMYPLNRPEVIIPNAADKFDSAGNLTDQHTKDKIQELLRALSAWAVQTRYEDLVGGKIS